MNDDIQQLRLVSDDERTPAPAVARTKEQKPTAGTRHGRSLDEFGEVLTIEEAAAVLRISRASAYEAARLWRATRTEGIPVVQIGRRLLVPRSALEDMLSANGKAAAQSRTTGR